MSILVAIDPSIRSSGVAIFLNATLWMAFRVQRSAEVADIGERAYWMSYYIAEKVKANIKPWVDGQTHRLEHVAYEWPQVYRASKSEGDPNDLLALVGIGQGVAAMLNCADILTYKPREWAGTIPKSKTGDPWASPRGKRIAERLADNERANAGNQHDVLDAVGIGLHALGRGITKRRRVMKGAT